MTGFMETAYIESIRAEKEAKLCGVWFGIQSKDKEI